MSRHVVCEADDLPPGSRRMVTIGRLELGVYNIKGDLVAVRNRCPHAGAPVCRGLLTGTTESDGPHGRRWTHDGEILKCPWHGWEFKLPEGETVAKPTYTVATYPAYVADGKVIVDMARSGRRTGEAEADT